MKQPKRNSVAADDMAAEYDFTGKVGTRGKYHRAYVAGHTVKVERADGSVAVQHFTMADGAVMLAPDVRRYFRDEEAAIGPCAG